MNVDIMLLADCVHIIAENVMKSAEKKRRKERQEREKKKKIIEIKNFMNDKGE